jgi:chromosome segregation ATPase
LKRSAELLEIDAKADKQELERVKRQGGEDEELQEVSISARSSTSKLIKQQINQLQDKLAGTQLDLDSRDQEIDELNRELDTKIRDHEKELEMVADEWRDEVAEARAQVEELRDVLEGREHDLKDIRETLIDREEELAIANDRVAELQAAQGETCDKLEVTLKNIDRDNAEKDADLIAANREIEAVSSSQLNGPENELIGSLASEFMSSKRNWINIKPGRMIWSMTSNLLIKLSKVLKHITRIW